MDPHAELLQTPAPPDVPRRWSLAPWLPVRSLHAHHRERILAHLTALSPEDRHLRFGQVATDEQLQAYVDRIDFGRDEVFGIFDARLRLLAMAHLAYAGTPADRARGEPAEAAEFGVSVLPRGRGRGLGGRLFELAVLHARNRSARTLVIHLARENSPMLAIVRRSGAQVRYEGSDAVAHLTLPDDTVGSHLGALVESQAADMDFRLKRETLRWRAWLHGLTRRMGPRS
jgi:GNAT superfamily N-acetyltransferase